MESSFQGHAKNVFFFFGMRYKHLLGEDYFAMMESHREARQKLEFLLNYIGAKGLKVYILIDEYDNFANTILSAEGMEKYHEITRGAGFFRSFFNILKGAGDQADSGLGRMFITGVSPLAMDDVTSGFNIGRNISLRPRFNELLGFTSEDVEDILAYYGLHAEDSRAAMRLMTQWYGNYRFCAESKQTLFNTDMVLYFMLHYLETGMPPGNMIDQNVRIDYVKLRHLLVLDRRLNGNFGYHSGIVETQKISPAAIAESFPAERLLKPSNFISLLFFFGLLTHSGEGELRVPNLTVKKLMYEYLREGYEDADVFSLDFYKLGRLIRDMACDGAWEPVFRFLADEVERQTSVRDYLSGEKVVKTFLLAYLNATDYYVTRSEEEFGKGFADLYLEPFQTKCPDRKYAYLIEIKIRQSVRVHRREEEKTPGRGQGATETVRCRQKAC